MNLFATYWFEIVYRPGKKNGKADALSRVETEKTEGKEFDKDSLLKPEQLVGFDDVDGEASYLALATNLWTILSRPTDRIKCPKR